MAVYKDKEKDICKPHLQAVLKRSIEGFTWDTFSQVVQPQVFKTYVKRLEKLTFCILQKQAMI